MYDDILNKEGLSLDEVLDDILSTPASSTSSATPSQTQTADQGATPTVEGFSMQDDRVASHQTPLFVETPEEHHEDSLRIDAPQESIATPSTSDIHEEETRKEMSPRLRLLKRALEEIQKHTTQALELLAQEEGAGGVSEPHDTLLSSLAHLMSPTQHAPLVPESVLNPLGASSGERVMEGVFDGQGMRGPDGMQYTVPANYASKSKLVEGDIMKLTITPQGTFLYKQIGPIGRKRIVGTLVQDPNTRDYEVVFGENRWRILTASVTYYKGVIGDDVVILIPAEKPTHWAAVENIIKKF